MISFQTVYPEVLQSGYTEVEVYENGTDIYPRKL